MVDSSELVVIIPCSIIASLLACVIIIFCKRKIEEDREREKLKKIQLHFKTIMKNRITPINSDCEEIKDEFKENEIRVEEITNEENV